MVVQGSNTGSFISQPEIKITAPRTKYSIHCGRHSQRNIVFWDGGRGGEGWEREWWRNYNFTGNLL